MADNNDVTAGIPESPMHELYEKGFLDALQTFKELFNQIIDQMIDEAPKPREGVTLPSNGKTQQKIVAPPFHGIDISNRAYNLLMRAGIDSIEKLTDCTEDDLLKIPGFGPASLESVVKALYRHGFTLHYEGSPFLRSYEEE